MFEREILKLFKVMVTTDITDDVPDVSHVDQGFITNFTPTPAQLLVLLSEFKPLDVRTLFTVHERKTADISHLLRKQVLNYIETYGLNMPGLFNLEQEGGKVVTLSYVRGVTRKELNGMVRNLLYANAPIKDTVALKNIINGLDLGFDLSEVKNNEMRVLLFTLGKNKFKSGDDAVRYICYVATESAMLIKSKRVIKSIGAKSVAFTTPFFADHAKPLAKVFHRHKNLILAAKTKENRSIINKISRMAKELHVPVHEPLKKRFVAEAYAGRIKDLDTVLGDISIRDKFSFLNLLEYKKLGMGMDAFIIRNGKVHLENNRPILNAGKVDTIIASVLKSLKVDLAHLKKQKILLDPNVDYGLPISRKQTMGQLPFGTTVTPKGEVISSGVYWENAWGAHDLDLSAIDINNSRTGWGMYSGYAAGNPVTYSGDITSAPNGAMEFMTSKIGYSEPYALFVNVFSGSEGCEAEIVVGSTTEKVVNGAYVRTGGDARWISEPVLREKVKLESKGNSIGFVRNGKFVVYILRLNSNSWSAGSKEAAIVQKSLTDFWTVRKLFDALKIKYDVDKGPKKKYDHNLSYNSFSLDKLEKLITAA